jgi:hypothetical protein
METLAPPSNKAGADMAALAFSLLSAECAELVNRRLTVAERAQLRDAMARNTSASDAERRAAVRALAAAVRNGFEWPTPTNHDDSDCPFSNIAQHPRYRVVEVLDRVALREPLEVIVTLCHLSADVRHELFERLSPQTREMIMPRLNEVHLVSTHQTREFARDIDSRLKGALRESGSARSAV